MRIARLRFPDDFSFRHAGKHHSRLFGPGFVLVQPELVEATLFRVF